MSNMDPEEDDDMPMLSGAALAALQNFYTENEEDVQAFEQLRSEKPAQLTIDMFKEDWNSSQFWFTDDTAKSLAQALLIGAQPGSNIAVISAPSVFLQLRNIISTEQIHSIGRISLFEFDQRFDLLDEFVKFDYNRLDDIPKDLESSFDRILCDPPYHSEECILKYAEAVSRLQQESSKIPTVHIVCTGSKMRDTVLQAFEGVQESTFRPEHTGRLDNKYSCYANVDIGNG